jgi:hypothetical protein
VRILTLVLFIGYMLLNSFHYKNEAIDVSGDPNKMNRYARRVEQIFGLH